MVAISFKKRWFNLFLKWLFYGTQLSIFEKSKNLGFIGTSLVTLGSFVDEILLRYLPKMLAIWSWGSFFSQVSGLFIKKVFMLPVTSGFVTFFTFFSNSCHSKRFLGRLLVAFGVAWLWPSSSGVGSMRSANGNKLNPGNFG